MPFFYVVKATENKRVFKEALKREEEEWILVNNSFQGLGVLIEYVFSVFYSLMFWCNTQRFTKKSQ